MKQRLSNEEHKDYLSRHNQLLGGYPTKDGNKIIGYHTSDGRDVYFEENDHAVQEQEADAVDVREQAEDGETVGQ